MYNKNKQTKFALCMFVSSSIHVQYTCSIDLIHCPPTTAHSTTNNLTNYWDEGKHFRRAHSPTRTFMNYSFIHSAKIKSLLLLKLSNRKTSTNRICRMAQLLSGEKIVLSDGSKVPAEEYLKDKVVALYFSAGWCPPCRAFTPKLKKFYEEVKKAGKNFEVVFVSRDRAADDLIEYFRDHHGPWAYLEFGNPKLQPLLEKFEVKTIPTCKVIKPDGTVVVNDARTEIQEKGVENALALWEEWMGFYEA